MQQLPLKPNGPIPNSPLPVLVYPQAAAQPYQQSFEDLLKANGWGGSWINRVYAYHHYHSNAHEFLGVISGQATLILGGPQGKEVKLSAGQALVLPAGTGHCLKQASEDFKVLGAYPSGQEDYDICTVEDKVEEKKGRIARVALPKADPLGGELLLAWRNLND